MKRLVICALLAGCGGGSIDLADLGTAFGRATCGKQFECCTDAEIMEQFMDVGFEGEPITTEEQCAGFFTAFYGELLIPQFQDSVAKGRIAYDGEALADCVAGIERLTCAEYGARDLGALPSSCDRFIIPWVADGGRCTYDHECISDHCVGASSPPGGPSTDGTCRPLPTAGQGCEIDCADGLYCGLDPSLGWVCQAKQADGMPCTVDLECASDHCDTTETCATKPLTCDGR
ncbi:MAG TPA: hypothetical protein VM734_13750 [Kofleriaceae bacterium]|jgi:hypothetical protein|nr:hypothetical protein [Kofleriaceae bacterium]